MKKFASLLFFLLAFTFLTQNTQASHVQGAYITYECLGPDSFRVHLYGYRDCSASVGFPTNVRLDSLGTSCGTPNIQPTWTTVSVMEITPVAPGVITTCTNSMSSIPGIEEHHLTRDYGFSNTSCDFAFEYSTCCRTGAMQNISIATDIYVYADTIHPGSITCNSSPQWNQPMLTYFQANTPFLSNQSATDPDGDSLVYSLTSCMSDAGVPAIYNPGYSPTAPLGSAYNIAIDPSTGILTVTPLGGGIGVFGICIMVEEYRNGVKIGEIIRESTFTLLSPAGCSTAPSFTGAINAVGGAIPTPNTFPTDTINLAVTPGQPFCFDLTTNDPDVGNANILSSFLLQPGATFTDTSGNNANNIYDINPIGRYCWTAPASGTYQEVFTLQDTSCYGFGYVSILLNIIVGDTTNVWPGDANNDLIANNLDLLALGLAYGNTGPARASISNTWLGYFSTPWQDTIAGPIDQKFQDCNGDGLVDANDTLAISLNYGLTHFKTRPSAARGQATDPPLRMMIPQDSASVGDTLHVPIMLGDSLINASNVYGVAFSINYDAMLIDSTTFSIEFSPSWIGNSSNSLNMDRNHFTIASCDAAQVRTDHQSVSGMGQIATAHFIIIDNIDGKRQTLETAVLTLDFADVVLIGLDGERLPVDPASDSLLIYQLTVETDPVSPVDFDLTLYPNPAGSQISIATAGATMQEIQILNLHGQLLSHNLVDNRSEVQLQLNEFADGVYFVKVRTEFGYTIRRLQIHK